MVAHWTELGTLIGSIAELESTHSRLVASTRDATIVGSIAVQFLYTFNEAPEGTNTGLVVEESRAVRGLLLVWRAESKVQLGFRLAAH